MKNQLFKVSPNIEITEKILENFGIKGINDNHSFTRENLIDLNTVENMNNMYDELIRYYIPCKAKKYLIDLNEKKCITILRQFLKIQNHTLMSKEKYINSKKILFYQVIPIQIDIKTNLDSEKVIISFD
jgi:glutamyl/glutaminyl-tRNA synthetase